MLIDYFNSSFLLLLLLLFLRGLVTLMACRANWNWNPIGACHGWVSRLAFYQRVERRKVVQWLDSTRSLMTADVGAIYQIAPVDWRTECGNILLMRIGSSPVDSQCVPRPINRRRLVNNNTKIVVTWDWEGQMRAFLFSLCFCATGREDQISLHTTTNGSHRLGLLLSVTGWWSLWSFNLKIFFFFFPFHNKMNFLSFETLSSRVFQNWVLI